VNWDFFVQELVNGLTLGSVYALIALGYSMVYGILKLLNFAHGDIYMVGAFIGYGVLVGLGGPDNPSVPVAALLALMFLAAMAGSGLLGVVVERVAYRPLRAAPRIAPLISALGVAFFLEYSVLLLAGADIRLYASYDLDNGALFSKGVHVGPLNVSLARLIAVGAAFVLMILLTLLVGRSKLGKAIRATSFDREAAAMMGINVDRVITATFLLGSALAGAAGVMVGIVFQQTYYLMGFGAGLKAFTAAVVGGIGSIPGAMLGGLLIGVAESLSTGYISSAYKDAIVFAILVVVMLVRPQGLLGRAEIKKV
jgi:branched-chain amino acid transport system permease protein